MTRKIIFRISDLLRIVAGIMLVGSMLISCTDVAGSFFGHPLLGSEEVVGLLASLIIAFALPISHTEKAHIGVDLLYLRFPKRIKKIDDIFISLVSTFFFLVAAWESYTYGNTLREVGRVSSTLQIPLCYMVYGLSFACLILALVIFLEFFMLLKEGKNG